MLRSSFIGSVHLRGEVGEQSMNMPKHTKDPRAGCAQVIVQSSDASRDRYLPIDEAKKLYTDGELHFDTENKAYCLPFTERDWMRGAATATPAQVKILSSSPRRVLVGY